MSQTVKPITLTILPTPDTTNISSVNTPSTLPLSSDYNIPMHMSIPVINTQQKSQNLIPNFNHVPIKPVIIPAPKYTRSTTHIKPGEKLPPISPNATQEEKLERQRYLNREKQRRYKEKTKAFVDLATLPTVNERIKQLWLVTYPNAFDNADPEVIDQLVTQFVASMHMATFNL